MVTVLTLLFCGSVQGGEVRQISIAGAGTSGTFYIMASGFADLFQKNLKITAVSEVTAGAVENARLLDAGKVEMGVLQLDVMLDALKGQNATFKEPVKISSLVPMYPNIVQVIALKDSPIKTFADLKGKKVSVGSPGSGILATNKIILETMGLSMETIDPRYLSFVETTDAFRDGQIDAAIVNTAAPAPWVVDLETTHPVKLIPFTAEDIKKFCSQYTYFVPISLTKDTYKSLDGDVDTFALWITLAALDSFPEQTAYDATRLIFENVETLKSIHSAAKYISLENVKSINVPFHPGAARYLKEKGIDVRVK
jgi:TRAP transporter TAXI family solute receptor